MIFSKNKILTFCVSSSCFFSLVRHKVSFFHSGRHLHTLVERFCARSSLKQRSGRAGRVRRGRCYRLMPKEMEMELEEEEEEEMRRCPLDEVVLGACMAGSR